MEEQPKPVRDKLPPRLRRRSIERLRNRVVTEQQAANRNNFLRRIIERIADFEARRKSRLEKQAELDRERLARRKREREKKLADLGEKAIEKSAQSNVS